MAILSIVGELVATVACASVAEISVDANDTAIVVLLAVVDAGQI
jgi:hypothetical protein